MCFNPKLLRSLNLTFFGLGPWAIIHGIAKLVNTFISQIRSLMTPFERSFSELSENQKILTLNPQNSSYGIWKRIQIEPCFAFFRPWTMGYNYIKKNQNIFNIGSMEFKLRQLNYPLINLGWGYHGHGSAKLANIFISRIWTLMTPFEMFFSKLSENHKLVEIG